MTMWLGSKTRMYVQLLSGVGTYFFPFLCMHCDPGSEGRPPLLIGYPSFLGVIFGSSTHEPRVKLIT